ncbi:MAG: fibrobacter succinogenes major paralogous domain-containing protein [Sphingobacteriaceae bacterium]
MKNRILTTAPLLVGLFFLSFFTFSCKKHTPAPAPTLTVTDADGNVYQTITIGTQTWMAENLKTTKYNDGTNIPYIADQGGWTGLSFPGYAWYNFDNANKVSYGALYNWHAVNTGKLAPTGWHVASEADWQTLLTFLGGALIAGDKLKEAGNTHWGVPSTNATNETGFTALPGGFMTNFGTSANLISTGYFWTATTVDASTAQSHTMSRSSAETTLNTYNKSCGLSVRCVKD